MKAHKKMMYLHKITLALNQNGLSLVQSFLQYSKKQNNEQVKRLRT